jgi:predicted nucleic acid-binding protein
MSPPRGATAAHAAITAAAARAGVPVVYTEDLNHGQRYDDVRVINPFLPR